MERYTSFNIFLLVALTLTSFLGGYILVDQEVQTAAKQKTGTLLDRFEKEENKTTDLVIETPTPKPISKKFLNLSPNINSFAFSPDNTKVVYFIPNKDKEGIVYVSSPDGSNSKVLLKTRVSSVGLSWIGESKVAVEIDPLKEPIVLEVSND